MSYILEALKKSDQQRQRGVTPGLPAAQYTMTPPPQRAYYVLLAAVLLCAGIAIGWLHPWQVDQPPPLKEPAPEKEAGAAKEPVATPQQSASLSQSRLPEPSGVKTRERPAPNATPAILPAIDRTKPDSSVSAQSGTQAAQLMPEKPANPADGTQKAIPMDELPSAIQQEIPVMVIQFHAYSSKPVERLVSINSRMLREGVLVSPELKLEQITPDGMIFSYKGYLFQHGIR